MKSCLDCKSFDYSINNPYCRRFHGIIEEDKGKLGCYGFDEVKKC